MTNNRATNMKTKTKEDMTMRAEENKRVLAEGVYVSNDTYQTFLNNNDLICGGSGSGKTSGYISHNLANPEGSYIVSDTKGILYRTHAKQLKEKGYKVRVLDFVNPENSMAYNPLAYIRRDAKGRVYQKDILKLTTLIAPSQDRDDPYWDNSARRYIATFISYVLENDRYENATMTDVIEVFSDYVERTENSEISMWCTVHSDTFTAKKFNDITSLTASEKTYHCIMDFVSQALDYFRYSEFEQIFGGEDEMHLADLGREKTVLFLNVSDSDTSFHVFSSIFNMQALQTLMETADQNADGRLKVPVRIILDDFAAGPHIDDFDNVISVIRSRNISVSVIVQSIAQLYSKYKENEANTIMANCDHKLILSATDKETATYVGFYLNKPAHSMLNMPMRKAILITTGEEPRFVDKLRPYGLVQKEQSANKQKNLA